MARMVVMATIAGIEVAARSLTGMQREVVLRDATGDGLPLPDGVRTNLTGHMRGLDVMPGDRITFVAHLDAHDADHHIIAADIADVVAFLRSLPREGRTGVRFRLRQPGGRAARTPAMHRAASIGEIIGHVLPPLLASHTKPTSNSGDWDAEVVARRGFEPLISALKG